MDLQYIIEMITFVHNTATILQLSAIITEHVQNEQNKGNVLIRLKLTTSSK